MSKSTNFKISKFVISFLDKKTGRVDEVHTTTFVVKPFCMNPENIVPTLQDKLLAAIDGDTRDNVLEVFTNRGRFVYPSKRTRRIFNQN